MENTMKQVKELLQMVKGLPTPENVKSLLIDLEQFMQVQEDIERGESGASAVEKWHFMRDQLQSSFENLSESLGYTPEMIQKELDSSPELGSLMEQMKEA